MRTLLWSGSTMEATDVGLVSNGGEGVPFEPETVRPEQFFEGARGVAEGERRLMAAVLLDAIECYVRFRHAPIGRDRALFREAERWIMRGRPGAPLSFEDCCHALGVPPEMLRRRLRQGRAVLPELRARGSRRPPETVAADPVRAVAGL